MPWSQNLPNQPSLLSGAGRLLLLRAWGENVLTQDFTMVLATEDWVNRSLAPDVEWVGSTGAKLCQDKCTLPVSSSCLSAGCTTGVCPRAVCPVTSNWCAQPESLLASESLSGEIRFMLVKSLSQWLPEGSGGKQPASVEQVVVRPWIWAGQGQKESLPNGQCCCFPQYLYSCLQMIV